MIRLSKFIEKIDKHRIQKIKWGFKTKKKKIINIIVGKPASFKNLELS